MRPFRTAICAALIAMTPLVATARWTVHGGGHHRGGRHRSSEHWPRHSSYIRRYVDPAGASYGVGPRDSHGRLRRSAAAKAAFERDNPCPSTGGSRGPCPGYVVDHIVPLKRGGADDPTNMQWQTTEDAKAKDRFE